MTIEKVLAVLEKLAPPAYQEEYDNAKLLTGSRADICTGVLCCLDITDDVLEEAIQHNCNLVVAHHPILFGGIKSITGASYVEKILIKAIKSDIALYAIHTNLDNVIQGVNNHIAGKLNLINCKILVPQKNTLAKLITYVPKEAASAVLDALFKSGAGHIGEYSEASFSMPGTGTFKGSDKTNPHIGVKGVREVVAEEKIEVLIPVHLQNSILKALFEAHPYEEVAYDLVPLLNTNQWVGSGLIGYLADPLEEVAFLRKLKKEFNLSIIKHTTLLGKPIEKIALCGGSGSFLIPAAKNAGADIFITADIKYHAFFDATSEMIIADIGHWESEQYVPEQLFAVLTSNFPNFAVLKSTVNTNPVHYFLG